VTDHFAVQWRQDASCTVDAVDFQAAIAEATAAQTEKDCRREIQALTTAAQLYEDDLLPGLYDDWITPVREDYRRLISNALNRLATLFEEQEQYAAAIPWADRVVALDPLSEAQTLGPVLVTTEGYSAAEVGATYGRALERSRQLDNRNIFVTLSGTWVFNIVRGDLKKALQFSLKGERQCRCSKLLPNFAVRSAA